MKRRIFVPEWIDHYQSETYRHVKTTVEPDGTIVAHFADGGSHVSNIYRTVEEVLAAGERDWRERVREVTE